MALAATDLVTLSRLLDQALELRADQREAWLRLLPAAERHFEGALRDMLAESDRTRASGFLSTLPPIGESDAAAAQPGDRVGAYRLIREIGRGGMGEVWLAERADGAYRRQVALKLPRMAWGAGLAQRMAREREIGALLEHPNIARMYDAGVDELGRPFIALEHIDGVPIDTWCASNSLTTRARLQLVAQVARAVSYAHGRLVVHRDLKPSNVLVTPDGQCHLLDFGIAKLLLDAAPGETRLTQDLGRVLTPHYASPEQLRGEVVSVQSDVYSLGVLAYELLAGAPPWPPGRGAFAGFERAMTHDEPPLASTQAADKATARLLKGEVDAILAKALRHEPTQRYASADALAIDIGCFLAGESVSARADPRWRQWARFARRHRIEVAAVGAVLVALLAGGTATVIQARHAARAAEREAQITQFVSEVFRGAPARQGASAASGARTAENLLEQGAGLIEQRFPGQPDLQAELHGVVAGIFSDMGVPRLGIEHLQRQLAALVRVDSDPAPLIRARMQLAQALLDDERLAEAETQAAAAVVQAEPDRELRADATVLLARIQQRRGELPSASVSRAAAAALYRDPYAPATVGRALLADVEGDAASGNAEKSRFYEKGVDLALKAEGAESTTAALIQIHLGYRMLFGEGETLQMRGRATIESAIAVLASRGGAEAIRAQVRRAHLYSALPQLAWGSPSESLVIVRAARQAIVSGPMAAPKIVLASLDLDEGVVLESLGRLREADQFVSRSAAVLHEGETNPGALRYLAAVQGILSSELGDYDVAERLIIESVRLVERTRGGVLPPPSAAPVLLAYNKLRQGRLIEADAILDKVERDSTPLVGEERAIFMRARATLMLARGDVDGAVREDKLFQAGDADPPSSHPGYAPASWTALHGEILCAADRAGEGLPALQAAIDVRAARVDPMDPEVARRRAVAGQCALTLHHRADALRLAQLAHQAFTLQPAVSAYFKTPLAVLDAKLARAAR